MMNMHLVLTNNVMLNTNQATRVAIVLNMHQALTNNVMLNTNQATGSYSPEHAPGFDQQRHAQHEPSYG